MRSLRFEPGTFCMKADNICMFKESFIDMLEEYYIYNINPLKHIGGIAIYKRGCSVETKV